MHVVPSLVFSGDCEEAFLFYANALQANLSEINRYSSMPADPAMPLPTDIAHQVMHVSLSKNGKMILMGADIMPGCDVELILGTNLEICLMPESKTESDRLFTALSQWGEVIMPMEDQFWGDYYGACKDKYGIGWMINCTTKK